MKNRRWLQTGLMALTGLVLFPLQTWACACCSDEAEYRISFRKPSAYELGLMQEMRFGPKANLIESQADATDDIKSPAHRADSYSLSALLLQPGLGG
jgi:hypothetical protein